MKKKSVKKVLKKRSKAKAKPKLKAKAKTTAKAKDKSPLKIVNIKLTSKDRANLAAQAKKYAIGNLSAWLRHAGLKYVPKKGETVVSDPWDYRR